MLQAITKENKFVVPALIRKSNIPKLRTNTYYCPSCKEQVILRAGDYVIPHFAHQRISACSQRQGESKTHLLGKFQLFHWLYMQNLSPHLEHYLPKINQYPDILLSFREKHFAMEYQCSKIQAKKLQKRSSGFHATNIYPIWILGANRLRKIGSQTMKMDSFTSQAIHQFAPHMPTQLFYYCPQKQQLLLVSDIYFTHHQRAVARFTYSSLKYKPFTYLFKPPPLSQAQLCRSWLPIKQDIRLNSRPVYGKEKLFRKWLYSKELHVQQLPSIIFLPNKAQHRMNLPLLHWQAKFIIDFLHPLAIGKSFTIREIHNCLVSSPFSKTPLLHTSMNNNPIKLYIEQLAQLGIVSKCGNQRWIKSRPVLFFNNIERGLTGDKLILEALYKKE